MPGPNCDDEQQWRVAFAQADNMLRVDHWQASGVAPNAGQLRLKCEFGGLVAQIQDTAIMRTVRHGHVAAGFVHTPCIANETLAPAPPSLLPCAL